MDFEQALSTIDHLPKGRETLDQEIDIRVGLGPVLMATKGFGVPEVESSYNRLVELRHPFFAVPFLVPPP